MKILKLTHTYHPSIGGGVRYKKAIVDYFRDQKHIVDVLAVSIDKHMYITSDDNGMVIRLPQLTKLNSSEISVIYPYVFGKLAPQYDVLHFNFPSPMCELGLVFHAGKIKGKKIVTYHADIVKAKRFSGLYNRIITRRFLQEMDHIVVSSPHIVDSSPHLEPFKDKVSVIPFGLDLEQFERPAKQVDTSTPSPQILFVGRIARYKGLNYLIEAMADSPGCLNVVGEGPLKEDCIQLRDQLRLQEKVQFLGRVSDQELVDLYHQADILVLPSIDAGEAFGYVIMEAMACHTAIISTELGTGTSFVNQHQETGLVVPPKDVLALTRAICKLAESPDILKRYQENAYQRVIQYFTIERMLQETENLYGTS